MARSSAGLRSLTVARARDDGGDVPRKPAPPMPSLHRSDAAHFDAWVNGATGAGTQLDKLAQSRVIATRDLWRDPFVLETLYYESDLAAKVVDALVDDAMRQGYEPTLRPSLDESSEDVDADDVKRRAERIKRRIRELKADEALIQRAKMGRLQGGSALFLGADDADPSAPLALDQVKRIRFIAEFERMELTPYSYYGNPLSADFGRVSVWRCTPIGTQTAASSTMATVQRQPLIHESRLLTFEGIAPSKLERQRQGGWGLSVLTRVIDVIRDTETNWRSVGSILQQAHQAVWKLKNLVSILANGKAKALQERMAQVELVRGIMRAVVIDADTEDFAYHSASLAGLSDLIREFNVRLAAAADMPVTRLLGTSPAGLNATGESDTRLWYDRVQTYRDRDLGPQVERLLRVVAKDVGDPSPEEWTVDWPSLWQMSPTEEATYRKMVADTDTAYVNAQVVSPAEVATTRFGGGSYSAESIQLDVEVRENATAAHDPEAAANAYPAPKTTEGTPAPAKPTDVTVDPELAKDPAAALNGAQVKSLQEIVMSVARKELPRESGIAMMLAAFPIEQADAEAIMGEVGRTFFVAVPDPAAQATGGQ